MIYQVTYLASGLKVKGYLGIPNNFRLSIATFEEMLSCFYKVEKLPMLESKPTIDLLQKDIALYKLPALIYCRGGIGTFGKVKLEWIEQFTKYRYIIFAPAYRGNEGGEGRDEFGGADIEDVVSAYQLIQSLPFIDPTRISVMGFSRGAINATRTAIDAISIHKLILWSGVSDLARTYEQRIDLRRMLKRVIGHSPTKKPNAYQLRSPLYWADRIPCPVLIIHGFEDVQVNFSHGLSMYNKLKELGLEVDIHCYEDCGHLFPTEIHQLAVKRMFDWLDK